MTEYLRNGLSPQQVDASRRRHGENVITPPRDDSAWRLFVDKFRDPIIQILLFAALLSLGVAFVDRDFTETIGILCAVVLATCVGFGFEWDAMRRFRRLNRVNDEIPVKVVRDGHVCEIPRREVVVGDVVCIESGETVPADGELVETYSLRIDESTLTGEPETGKTADPNAFDPEATYPSNFALRGTTVIEGSGRMVVTAVGDRTEAGCVTVQAGIETGEQTPLNRQLTRLSQLIGKAGIGLSAAIFAVLTLKALLTGGVAAELAAGDWLPAAKTLLRIFMVSVAVIVMAVPEGLPMSITLSLAMSMRRMLRTNNLVRKMHACETMGAVTVICTDKTGTLTRNKMTVSEIIRCGDLPEALFAESVAVNTTAFLDAAGRPLGNPTEGALLSWLHERGYDYAALRAASRVVDRIPFSTERKYMATIVEEPATGRRMLCVKGAPEIVRALCRHDDCEAATAAALAGFQQRAMRTLGFAWCETDAGDCEKALLDGQLIFTAIAAIADPVREDVPAAVARCLHAGIAIKVITGDTVATACEIARQIGLWDDTCSPERNTMSGSEFAALSDEEALERIGELRILARARPLDKQRLVQLLQRRGEVVAVTGDGTNDAPALNFANVGLSMGSGTSVAKDASDITLLDDSFASIATAVLWGRSLYRNIQRFVLFQLTINVAAIVIVLVGSIIGTELPLTVVQILWVNLIMDTFAAMAMASLPPDPAVMNDRPRPRDEFIITPAMVRTLAASAGIFIVVLLGMMGRWLLTTGGMNPVQLTVFFTVFVFLQFWNLFNVKGFGSPRSGFADLGRSPVFLLVLALIFIGQVAIVEFGGTVFRTVPLTLGQWLCIIGGTSLIALIYPRKTRVFRP